MVWEAVEVDICSSTLISFLEDLDPICLDFEVLTQNLR
jgi:hypothetical protein